MERVNIFFLHGFLGLPQDWENVLTALKLPIHVSPYMVDYFHEPTINAQVELDRWGQAFNKFVLSKQGKRNILVGYSLGGRLALQALADNSALWNHAVFISTNPGFDDRSPGFDQSQPERAKRWLNDSYWAEKFRAGEWSEVLKAWNAQPVFGEKTTEPLRLEKKYSRESLSLALTNWSLAQQKNKRDVLKANAKKISWIVGKEDSKFVEMAQTLHRDIPEMHTYAVPEAAHRILFDQPVALAKLLHKIVRG